MDDDAVAWTLEQLWSPIVAVTAAHEGRANGLIASTAVTASLLPETPRVAVVLSKANLTHGLVLSSGAFALHLLPATPAEALDRSLALFRTLGMRSGRDVDKLAGISVRPGATGSPLLADALTYVEARVAATLDAGDVTVVVADVVAGARLREGDLLTIDRVVERVPPEWLEEWQRKREREIAEGRRRRQESV